MGQPSICIHTSSRALAPKARCTTETLIEVLIHLAQPARRIPSGSLTAMENHHFQIFRGEFSNYCWAAGPRVSNNDSHWPKPKLEKSNRYIVLWHFDFNSFVRQSHPTKSPPLWRTYHPQTIFHERYENNMSSDSSVAPSPLSQCISTWVGLSSANPRLAAEPRLPSAWRSSGCRPNIEPHGHPTRSATKALRHRPGLRQGPAGFLNVDGWVEVCKYAGMQVRTYVCIYVCTHARSHASLRLRACRNACVGR